ncbi:MAG: transporter substrate-binding domain-containing protein, partial [Bacteroidales bacterium]|nr:transporter substrate-binding domain-containing protein [Bacteroidales bacterium]
MMKKTIFLCALIFLSFFRVMSEPGIHEMTNKLQVTYLGDQTYSPYEYLDENGNPSGYNIVLIKRIAEMNNWDLTIKMHPWPQILDSMTTSTNIYVASMLYSQERNEIYHFSLPHSKVNYSMFVHKQSRLFNFSQLHDKTILVQEKDIMHEFVLKIGNNNKIITFDSFKDALYELNKGTGDVVLCPMIQGNYYIESGKLKNIISSDNPFAPFDYCYSTNQSNEHLLTDINETLLLLKETGELEKLHDEWYGDFEGSDYVRFMHRYGKLTFFLLGLFLLSAYAVIFTLRRTVKKKTQSLKDELKTRVVIEENLRIAKEKAEESDRLKTAFLENMSHEIRTPMNGILGFTELILNEECDSKAEEKSYLEIIKQSGIQLLKIISNIISISKIDAGEITNQPRKFNPMELLQEAKSEFNEILDKKQIDIIIKAPNISQEERLIADDIIIRQIISHLLSNAVKYTKDGNIYVDAEIRNDKFIVAIKDNGAGVPKAQQEKIFTRFYQPNHSLSHVQEGLGLGLAICKGLCNVISASITLDPKVRKGAIFTIEIPVKITEKANSEINPKPSRNWDEYSILIAEDNDENFFLFRAALKSTGVKIIRANDGAEAINITKTMDIDLILMDIIMPNIDGF